jgi:hypothetical protein
MVSLELVLSSNGTSSAIRPVTFFSSVCSFFIFYFSKYVLHNCKQHFTKLILVRFMICNYYLSKLVNLSFILARSSKRKCVFVTLLFGSAVTGDPLFVHVRQRREDPRRLIVPPPNVQKKTFF